MPCQPVGVPVLPVNKRSMPDANLCEIACLGVSGSLWASHTGTAWDIHLHVLLQMLHAHMASVLHKLQHRWNHGAKMQELI